VLGSDLTDDHPISFAYDATLALRHGRLADPATLPQTVPLDNTGQLQCTSCHDPHVDRYRKFLRIDDRAAALCSACHQQSDDWANSSHANSPATWRGTGTDPWPHTPFDTVADNGCENCHRSHAAPHPPRLLSHVQEHQVCLVCHDGSVAAHNIGLEFLKSSAHRLTSDDLTHEPTEDPNSMPRHVTCVDCHNPHETTPTPASPPVVSGRLQGVPGVNISGGTVREASYEYEVCLKCHGIRDQTTALGIVRQDNTRNVRLEISTANPSYHPVAAMGRNQDMGGFEIGYSTASLIYCTDCHNNDEWTGTGTVPRGPHGSRLAPLLEQEYQTDDATPETFQSYALCYKCHDRSYLINDQANTFAHGGHVRGQNAPCAACHDAHGSRQHEGLINFMIRDRAGNVVVAPSSSGRLEYLSLGPGRGQCFLQCHDRDHDPEAYP
jgi:predicted CXXCH cytochrome family protein